MAAVFRSRSRRIRNQRTISHHAARSGSERRHPFRLLGRARRLLLWLLTRAAVMPGTRRLTALARLDRQGGIIGFSGHRHIAATEKTAAGHPDRDADRERQLNHFAHRFVREKQTHSAGVYSSMALFVEVGTRIKIVIKFHHFCNGRLVSLKS